MDLGNLRVSTAGSRVEVTLEVDVAAVIRRPVDMAVRGCTWGAESETVVGATRRISRVAACTSAPETLELPFVQRMPERFQLLVQQGASALVLVDRARPEVPVEHVIEHARTHVGIASFVGAGIAHVGAAPSEWRDGRGGWKLPDGIDHILFLLGLLLGGGTLLRMLGVATGFTVGHTITLGLAAFGIVRPPSCLIEPLIALSIAFVAVESLTGTWHQHRWKIAMGFGLIHGFGFANALTSLGLTRGAMAKALFGYNVGVELGQLAIVLVAAPLVLVAYRRPATRRWIITPASLAILVAGLYWFGQRVI
jgi:hypothetical protein